MEKRVQKSRVKTTRPRAPAGTIAWLVIKLEQAEATAAVCREARKSAIAQGDAGLIHYATRQADYWLNVCAGIKWLMYHARKSG